MNSKLLTEICHKILIKKICHKMYNDDNLNKLNVSTRVRYETLDFQWERRNLKQKEETTLEDTVSKAPHILLQLLGWFNIKDGKKDISKTELHCNGYRKHEHPRSNIAKNKNLKKGEKKFKKHNAS